jgi:hypothetical protein
MVLGSDVTDCASRESVRTTWHGSAVKVAYRKLHDATRRRGSVGRRLNGDLLLIARMGKVRLHRPPFAVLPASQLRTTRRRPPESSAAVVTTASNWAAKSVAFGG